MVRIGTVWDSTVEVLAGRRSLIVPIAALALLLPAVLRAAAAPALVPGSMAASIAGLVLSLGVALASIWGQLAIIAIASDPATTLRDAAGQAAARLLPVIGVALVVTVAAGLLLAPLLAALWIGGFDWQRFVAAGGNRALMPMLPPGIALFVLIYSVGLFALALWAGARLLVTYAVVLNERRGLGAIGRSIALTRGSTWRLIGTIILFALVAYIASTAVRLVVGTIARLLLGPERIAAALVAAGLFGAVVGTVFSVIAYVFVARFYVAARDREATVPAAR